MAKHGDLQKRLLKAIGYFYPCQEIDTVPEQFEFVLQINPFQVDYVYILIQKLKNKDAIRINCIIQTNTKIKNILKQATPDDRNQIISEFEQVYHRYNTELVFEKDDRSLQNIKPMLTQNLSFQEVINTIVNNTILVQDVIKLLIALDSTVESAELNNTSTMFQ